MNPTPKLRVGISSCLRGNDVRYDGSNRLNLPILEGFQELVEWVTLCPEADAGFGVPRETIVLVGNPKAPRVETTGTRLNKTEALSNHCQKEVAALKKLNLAGFILKARSPSCGPRVSITLNDGSTFPDGQGIFVAELRKAFPALPLATEEELQTPSSRNQFIEDMRRYIASSAP